MAEWGECDTGVMQIELEEEGGECDKCSEKREEEERKAALETILEDERDTTPSRLEIQKRGRIYIRMSNMSTF
ncbi:hypothetical protein RAB80_016704 [Fusarium oxysporum f. sp. vasinfectum]|nr:hypothetical protein RAB80_016704 [Fusarium oxysporum f. sp. vasinfectum]KAK2694839.1 hypothetical protein QWA68_005555 [Fusarium oxysporum]KAK2924534.1 hypothetical protein FoTM2_014812 [Fusarium oxysporum f. sp. vasinfectum]